MVTCPLCGSGQAEPYATAYDVEYYTSDRPFEFHRCPKCDVLFISPMLHDHLDRIYPPTYYSFSEGPKTIAEQVKEYMDQRKFGRILTGIKSRDISVLDIGGGTGWLLDLIRSADSRVTSTAVVDIDQAAGRVAEQRGHTYFLGRIEEYPAEGTFDLVLMLNLIEHVANPKLVLRKAGQLLRPGGRLILKTPNFDSLDARLFRRRSWGGYHTPRHFVIFNRDSLVATCADCGLSPVHFSYTQGAPFWSVSLLNELKRVGLATVSAERPAIRHPLMPWLQVLSAGFDFARRPFAKLSQMELILERAG